MSIESGAKRDEQPIGEKLEQEQEMSEEDRLLQLADELLASGTKDKFDLLTIKNINQVKSKNWPKEFKDETIIDFMKIYLKEKPKLQKMDEQIKDHERKSIELRLQRRGLEEEVKKADEAVKNQLKKLGLK